MRVGWQTRQLGEIAELKGRIGWKGLSAKEYTDEGPLFLSVHSLNYGDCVDFKDAFHISEERYIESPEIMLQNGDVLICKDGAGIGKLGIIRDLPSAATINSSLLLIRAKPEIESKFLYHCLCSPYFQEIVGSRLNGATTPHLYQRDIAEFPVHIPSLAEQQRIVGILDQAFAAIDTAKANADKNLQNTRDLYKSYVSNIFDPNRKLPESLMAKGQWLTKPISQCFSVRSGDFLPAKLMVSSGPYDVYGGNGVNGKHSKTNLSGQNIIIGRVGAKCGNVRLVVGDCWVTDNAFYISRMISDFDLNFLASLLSFTDLHRTANQAAQPVISYSTIKNEMLKFPVQLEVQKEIASDLAVFKSAIKSLEAIVAQKIACFRELRSSLLRRAFLGEI
jgi:type I restriction enzyme, S subunit